MGDKYRFPNKHVEHPLPPAARDIFLLPSMRAPRSPCADLSQTPPFSILSCVTLSETLSAGSASSLVNGTQFCSCLPDWIQLPANFPGELPKPAALWPFSILRQGLAM